MKKTEAIVKIDSESNWLKAKNYIPTQGTIIVYEYENSAPRIKMGNGIDLVADLPFLINPPRVTQDTLEL